MGLNLNSLLIQYCAIFKFHLKYQHCSRFQVAGIQIKTLLIWLAVYDRSSQHIINLHFLHHLAGIDPEILLLN